MSRTIDLPSGHVLKDTFYTRGAGTIIRMPSGAKYEIQKDGSWKRIRETKLAKTETKEPFGDPNASFEAPRYD